MSRCFPYPPPGYVCNRAPTGALIESIKIESERNKVKQERKEQKRSDKDQKKKEKKEKKREKVKEKLRSTQNTDGINKRKRESLRFDDSVFKSSANSKELHLQKKNVPEAEQLERSSLEEEHGQPVLPEGLCYSSDGTSKTKRCKIEQSPSNANCTQGKVIRFRLRRREPEKAQLTTNDMPSTAGRTGNWDTEMFDASVKDGPCVVATAPKPDEDTKGVFSRPVVQSAKDGGKLPIWSPSGQKIQKPKSAYEALLGSWFPPSIHFDAIEGGDDENWLFQSKKPTEQTSASLKAYDGLSSLQRTSLWPHAHLLPEVDLFVLPFTVPF